MLAPTMTGTSKSVPSPTATERPVAAATPMALLLANIVVNTDTIRLQVQMTARMSAKALDQFGNEI